MNHSSKKVGVVILAGMLIGISIYTFIYAKGWSYLTNNPETCVNCHIMQTQYDGWMHSSHRMNMGCNSCHTPSDFLGKWYTKASNGFWHSFYFTTGAFHEPIQITKRSLKITEKRCQQCHETLTLAIHGGQRNHQDDRWCTRCHSNVGHLH